MVAQQPYAVEMPDVAWLSLMEIPSDELINSACAALERVAAQVRKLGLAEGGFHRVDLIEDYFALARIDNVARRVTLAVVARMGQASEAGALQRMDYAGGG
jgi:hypothetical protein